MALINNTMSRLGRSTMGQWIKRGALESVGFVFEKQADKMVNKGFLGGLNGNMGARISGGMGLGFTALSVYQGYQENGIGGAVEGAATGVLGSLAGNVLMSQLPNPVTWGLAAVAAAGYGGFRFGQAATQYRKDLRKTELVTRNSYNAINAASTDRARALQALNNSSMNARMSIGNEAQLLHTSYSGMSTFRR